MKYMYERERERERERGERRANIQVQKKLVLFIHHETSYMDWHFFFMRYIKKGKSKSSLGKQT